MLVLPESPSVADAGAMVIPALSSLLAMVTVALSERPPAGVWPTQFSQIVYLPCRFTLPVEVSGSNSMVTDPLSPKAESSTVWSSMTLRVSFRPKVTRLGRAPVMYCPSWEACR